MNIYLPAACEKSRLITSGAPRGGLGWRVRKGTAEPKKTKRSAESGAVLRHPGVNNVLQRNFPNLLKLEKNTLVFTAETC